MNLLVLTIVCLSSSALAWDLPSDVLEEYYDVVKMPKVNIKDALRNQFYIYNGLNLERIALQ